jgi:hypothetical protein
VPSWLGHDNLDGARLGIGGKAPIERINKGRGQYTQNDVTVSNLGTGKPDVARLRIGPGWQGPCNGSD